MWYYYGNTRAAGSIAQSYLCCLADHAKVFSSGVVDAIHHGQLVQYYKDILAGKAPVARHRKGSVRVATVARTLDRDDGLLWQGFPSASGEDTSTVIKSDVLGENDEKDSDADWPQQSDTDVDADADAQAQLEDSRLGDAAVATELLQGLPDLSAESGAKQQEETDVHRMVSEQTIPSWGPGFRFTYRAPSATAPCGAWQATCRYHRHTATARCTKTLTLAREGSEEQVRCLRLCMHWCVQAHQFQTASQHSGWNPRLYPLPEQCVIDAQARTMPVPPPQAAVDSEIEHQGARKSQKLHPKKRRRGAEEVGMEHAVHMGNDFAGTEEASGAGHSAEQGRDERLESKASGQVRPAKKSKAHECKETPASASLGKAKAAAAPLQCHQKHNLPASQQEC